MRDIKRRKGSIQSTQQITKAMKLVSTVKLQKAKGRAEQTDPYFQYMYRTVSSILAHSGNMDHPYLRSGESKKKAIVVLTSNRGLAGGYNANVVSRSIYLSNSLFRTWFCPIYRKFRKNLFIITSPIERNILPDSYHQIGIFLFQALIDLTKIRNVLHF